MQKNSTLEKISIFIGIIVAIFTVYIGAKNLSSNAREELYTEYDKRIEFLEKDKKHLEEVNSSQSNKIEELNNIIKEKNTELEILKKTNHDLTTYKFLLPEKDHTIKKLNLEKEQLTTDLNKLKNSISRRDKINPILDKNFVLYGDIFYNSDHFLEEWGGNIKKTRPCNSSQNTIYWREERNLEAVLKLNDFLTSQKLNFSIIKTADLDINADVEICF